MRLHQKYSAAKTFPIPKFLRGIYSRLWPRQIDQGTRADWRFESAALPTKIWVNTSKYSISSLNNPHLSTLFLGSRGMRRKIRVGSTVRDNKGVQSIRRLTQTDDWLPKLSQKIRKWSEQYNWEKQRFGQQVVVQVWNYTRYSIAIEHKTETKRIRMIKGPQWSNIVCPSKNCPSNNENVWLHRSRYCISSRQAQREALHLYLQFCFRQRAWHYYSIRVQTLTHACIMGQAQTAWLYSTLTVSIWWTVDSQPPTTVRGLCGSTAAYQSVELMYDGCRVLRGTVCTVQQWRAWDRFVCVLMCVGDGSEVDTCCRRCATRVTRYHTPPDDLPSCCFSRLPEECLTLSDAPA